MKLKIKKYSFFPDDVNSCIDSLLIQIINQYNKKIWDIFDRASLVTKEVEKPNKISDFSTNNGINYERLELYYGLKKIYINNYSDKQIMNLLKKNVAIFLLADTFFCKFDLASYHRKHSPHYVLLGLKKDNFIIYDNHLAYKGFKISLKDFKDMRSLFKMCFIFEYKKVENTRIHKVFNEFEKDKQIYCLNSFEKVLNKYILTNKNEEIEQVPNFIYDMAQGKMQFSIFLKNSGKKNNNVKNVQLGNVYYVLYNEWNTIFGMFLKYSVEKNNTNLRNRLCNRIKYSIKKEIDAVQSFYDRKACAPRIHRISFSYSEKNMNFTNSIKLDISKLFTNKAFYAQGASAFFAHSGASYFLPSNEILNHIAKTFDISYWNSPYNDNVICNGQKIFIDDILPQIKYIKVLGSAEIIDQIDKIQLLQNNRIIEYDLCLTRWNNIKIPHYGEKIIYSGALGSPIDGKIVRRKDIANIYEYVIKTEFTKGIEAIRLPFSPNIHIFGLTILG